MQGYINKYILPKLCLIVVFNNNGSIVLKSVPKYIKPDIVYSKHTITDHTFRQQNCDIFNCNIYSKSDTWHGFRIVYSPKSIQTNKYILIHNCNDHKLNISGKVWLTLIQSIKKIQVYYIFTTVAFTIIQKSQIPVIPLKTVANTRKLIYLSNIVHKLIQIANDIQISKSIVQIKNLTLHNGYTKLQTILNFTKISLFLKCKHLKLIKQVQTQVYMSVRGNFLVYFIKNKTKTPIVSNITQ